MIGIALNLPCSSDGKESAYSAGDLGSIPGSGRSSGEGNGNPVQYSCLDRGAWQAMVPGIAESQTRLIYIGNITESMQLFEDDI